MTPRMIPGYWAVRRDGAVVGPIKAFGSQSWSCGYFIYGPNGRVDFMHELQCDLIATYPTEAEARARGQTQEKKMLNVVIKGEEPAHKPVEVELFDGSGYIGIRADHEIIAFIDEFGIHPSEDKGHALTRAGIAHDAEGRIAIVGYVPVEDRLTPEEKAVLEEARCWLSLGTQNHLANEALQTAIRALIAAEKEAGE